MHLVNCMFKFGFGLSLYIFLAKCPVQISDMSGFVPIFVDC